MENKMTEVAKLLGVELEEEFKIKGVPERYKFTEIGLKYLSTKEKGWFLTNNILNLLLTGELSIIKLPKPILDEKEKEYLSAVIKPFKKKKQVKYIRKCRKFSGPKEYISIAYVDSTGDNVLNFPDFKANKMYQGMKSDKLYKLEELGL